MVTSDQGALAGEGGSEAERAYRLFAAASLFNTLNPCLISCEDRLSVSRLCACEENMSTTQCVAELLAVKGAPALMLFPLRHGVLARPQVHLVDAFFHVSFDSRIWIGTRAMLL